MDRSPTQGFMVSPNGQETKYHFTESNSPHLVT
jgi:hypothetical protein